MMHGQKNIKLLYCVLACVSNIGLKLAGSGRSGRELEEIA